MVGPIVYPLMGCSIQAIQLVFANVTKIVFGDRNVKRRNALQVEHSVWDL